MTAGQGGPGWQPPQGGAPQGWNAPPAPPPYGQQYPGYGPGPAAPTGFGAPPAMERPVTVRAGIGAFVGSIVLSVVSAVIMALNWDEVFGPEFVASLGGITAEEADVLGSLGGIVLMVSLLFTAVFALFVWFAWRGHNWARIVLWIVAGLGIAFGLMGVAAGSPLPVLTALGTFELLFDVAGVVLLALKPSNEWYRFRTWQRATGQG